MRKFAFALLAIFFVTNTFAQEESTDSTSVEISESKAFYLKPKAVSWGVKANVNIASDRNAPENRSRTGFAAGLFMEVRLSDRFSIQPELLYSQQGSWQYLTYSARTSGDNVLQVDYLNLPILLKIYVYKNKLSVEVGPQFGYLLSAYEKRTPRSQTKRREKIDSDWVNDYDIAAALGVTYKIQPKKWKCPFEVYARYTYGFMDTYTDDVLQDSQFKYFRDNKNSVIQIGMAARF